MKYTLPYVGYPVAMLWKLTPTTGDSMKKKQDKAPKPGKKGC